MILLKRKRIFVLIAVFTLLILISGSASSATLYVKEGGTGSYENLQEAVNAASEGDIILVGKGQYSENVLVNKSLEISSTNHNPEKTVITALDPEAPVFHIVSDSVKISGFSIKGANLHMEFTLTAFLEAISLTTIFQETEKYRAE